MACFVALDVVFCCCCCCCYGSVCPCCSVVKLKNFDKSLMQLSSPYLCLSGKGLVFGMISPQCHLHCNLQCVNVS